MNKLYVGNFYESSLSNYYNYTLVDKTKLNYTL